MAGATVGSYVLGSGGLDIFEDLRSLFTWTLICLAARLKHDCRYVRLSWTSTLNASHSLIGQLYPYSLSGGLAGGPAQLSFEKDHIRGGINTVDHASEQIGPNE
jgi:hypothetical protein